MNKLDKSYLDLLIKIRDKGYDKGDRTQIGSKALFGEEIKHQMSDGFPFLTSKKMFSKGIIYELLWFLKGNTNIKYLVDNEVNIWVGDSYAKYSKLCSENDSKWNKWMRENLDKTLSMFTVSEFVEKIKTDKTFSDKWGELGPIYGSQWVNWGKGDDIWEESKSQSGVLISKPNPGINQIQNLVNDLKNNPDSRRLIVNSWNVSDINKMTLPPCHYCFECDTRLLSIEERKNEMNKMGFKTIPSDPLKAEESFDYYNVPKRMLSLKWTQRSVDTFTGLPFNISSYGFLLEMLAQQCNMVPGQLIGSLGNTHIYNNHFEAIEEQLKAETYSLPTLKLKKATSIFDYKYEDFEIINYQSSSTIKAPLNN